MITGSWRRFCQVMTKIFYRHYEVDGLDHLLQDAPVLLCANHANALADAVILQAVSSRLIHPLARSGLFKNPFLRPILAMIQAVPIYRRQDEGSDTAKNRDTFVRCYEMFQHNEVLLIFPEGQSHSDPSLRPIKTGAARMALGARDANGHAPVVLPVGLNFSSKGRFRSTVYVRFGEPIHVASDGNEDEESQVKALTTRIYEGLDTVTLNVESHEEMDFIRSVERFFALRHGKYRHRSLELRFKAMKKLAEAAKKLKQRYPEKMVELKRQLNHFERLCRHWDINDYHLTLRYRPTLITRFIFRSLAILFIILPLGVWGILNSFLPFVLTRFVAHKVSKDTDQYDTAKMVFGLFFFILFWGAQIALVANFLPQLLLLYCISLPVAAAAAIMLRNERRRILENIRVFFLFVRKRRLRRYLEERRCKIEKELAHLVRLVKKQPEIT